MSIYIIFGIIIVVGLARVVLLLIQEKKTTSVPKTPKAKITPPKAAHAPADVLSRVGIKQDTPTIKPLNKPKKSIFLSLFKKRPKLKTETPKKKAGFWSVFKSRLKKAKKKDLDLSDIPEATKFPNLKEQLEKGTFTQPSSSFQKPIESGTATLTTQKTPEIGLSQDEEKEIENEINAHAEISELKEKYARIDKLLAEKNTSLEKTASQLENELKNRKEFNKVKDILEKELKEVKDKSKEALSEIYNKEAESESYKKRVAQLEEKTTALEKEILAKEDEVDLLLKKIEHHSKEVKPTEEKQAPEIPKESIEEQAEAPQEVITNEEPPLVVANETSIQIEEVPAAEPPKEEPKTEEQISEQQHTVTEEAPKQEDVPPVEKPPEEQPSEQQHTVTEETPKQEDVSPEAEASVTDIPERDESPNEETEDNTDEQPKKDETQ